MARSSATTHGVVDTVSGVKAEHLVWDAGFGRRFITSVAVLAVGGLVCSRAV
eukprot:CAMPEP_0183362688 /NCGR_PEP_ID=MMETSP0164_2-20130417/70976_1 /TAXON_ID=221442 /ORGANISM="Coccolithus pelagicus ssp braarudi, Strain PLY182g" /LENGTH=51 /DNA_ID=CAMNT_0025537613 /DNA_START=59 /DNA_END=211 /DNA_ORIENTATION=+